MTKCSCQGNFLEKFVQPFILMQLYKNKQHGFSIYMKLLESDIMDYSGIDPGGVYRTLNKMEAAGLLLSDWHTSNESAQPRRVYEITEEGKQCLLFWGKTLDKYKDEVSKFSQAILDCLD